RTRRRHGTSRGEQVPRQAGFEGPWRCRRRGQGPGQGGVENHPEEGGAAGCYEGDAEAEDGSDEDGETGGQRRRQAGQSGQSGEAGRQGRQGGQVASGEGRQREDEGRSGGREQPDEEELGGSGGGSAEGQADGDGDEAEGRARAGVRRGDRRLRRLPGQDARQAPPPARGGARDLHAPGPRPGRRGGGAGLGAGAGRHAVRRGVRRGRHPQRRAGARPGAVGLGHPGGRGDRPGAAPDGDRQLRHLRAVRQEDRRGPAGSAALRRPVHRVQVPRGAPPLTADAAATQAARRSPAGPLAVAAGLVVIDQLTKVWAVAALSDGPVRVVGSLLELRLTRNPGGAFSLLTNLTPVLAVVAVLMAAWIVRTTRRTTDAVMAYSLALVLGGAVGNLVDRLVRSPGF